MRPRFLTAPPAVSNAALEAVDLARFAGLELDSWQQLALESALGVAPNDQWSAFEFALVMPRQNGKGAVLEALELFWLFLVDADRVILHSAHEFKTAVEAFRRILQLIQSTPDLDKEVSKVRTAHGSEGIELRNGKRLNFVARSRGSGRGFSGDKIVLDESYDLSDDAISALLYTMSARSLEVPGPQLVYTSSAPLPDPRSDVLRRLMRRGRDGSPGLAYMEYSVPDDADQDSPEVWLGANPGLGIRISEAFVARERKIDPNGFPRERLGIVDLETFNAGPISEAAWLTRLDMTSGPKDRVEFALDVSPDRASASIAVCGESTSGGEHVELVDHRVGTHWLIDRARSVQAEHGGRIAVAVGSPAWSLEPDLRNAGVELLEISPADHAQACGSFVDAVAGDHPSLRHRGDPDFLTAIRGSKKRAAGDAWLWDRKNSTVDISPIVAATLARWAFVSVEEAVLCAY